MTCKALFTPLTPLTVKKQLTWQEDANKWQSKMKNGTTAHKAILQALDVQNIVGKVIGYQGENSNYLTL